jgi:hypothetical protein
MMDWNFNKPNQNKKELHSICLIIVGHRCQVVIKRGTWVIDRIITELFAVNKCFKT